MSVMLKRQMPLPCPCTPDCADRSGTCTLHCPHGYAEYRAARDKMYAAQAAAAEASRIASAGKRKASAKKARMAHRHKR